MKRKRKTRPDTIAMGRIADRLAKRLRSPPTKDGKSRTITEDELVTVRQEMLSAWRIRPRYQKHFPRLAKIWQKRLRPLVDSRWPGGGLPDDWFEFAAASASLMQDLEDQHGAFPVRVRWAVYDAFAKAAGFSSAIELGNADAEAKEKSRRLNETKRRRWSLDERDAAIVEEWVALGKEMPGKGARDEYVARKYGLECGRSVRNIRKKAGVA